MQFQGANTEYPTTPNEVELWVVEQVVSYGA